jgi:hypothetical protein
MTAEPHMAQHHDGLFNRRMRIYLALTSTIGCREIFFELLNCALRTLAASSSHQTKVTAKCRIKRGLDFVPSEAIEQSPKH